MIFNRAVHWARNLDTRWQRTWNPERRRVLINAALPMEYAMIEPVYKRMRGDSRVEFYFTSTTHPDEMNQIFAIPTEHSNHSSRTNARMKFDFEL
jgi:hypothetical protein